MGVLSHQLVFVKGVGENRAKLLQAELGLESIEDLLNTFPFRYDNRSDIQLIKNVKKGEQVQLYGMITFLEDIKTGNRKRLVGTFKDASGFINLTWFSAPAWLREKIRTGVSLYAAGKVNVYKGIKNINHPELETESQYQSRSNFLPVYSSTEKLNKNNLGLRFRRKIITTVLEQLSPSDIPEIFPESITKPMRLCSRYEAYKWIHMPENQTQIQAATYRLKFEELFFLQLKNIQQKKINQQKLIGYKFESVGTHFHEFYKTKLTFELTDAQKRVLKEIRADMGRGLQMNRLLQGDVGSGKTIVALMSMLIAIDNGFQACLLAPTEILAQQHFNSIQEMVKGLGIQVGFLSGSVTTKTREQLLFHLKEGHLHILIGTHAILEDRVQFKRLGLAVTDEQHRFGVAQRARLWTKSGEYPPHILVMTATPIPRTLAMTTMGDLEVSIIDELPPGRKPVKTVHRNDAHRSLIYKFLKEEIAKGRQVYVVYPLIEESANLDLQNLQEGYEDILRNFPRPDYQVSIVHGRMKAADKDLEMQRFAEGHTQIMVATTVIEVGVNVPNASVMIIENAERFGLSQLHQLRGRVGRGAEQSFCILITKSKLSKYSQERIKTMCQTNDGFKIAEADLRLRGPGDMEGTQQSGVMELKIANIAYDGVILERAQYCVNQILNQDLQLEHPNHAPIRAQLQKLRKRHKSWGRIS